MKNYIFCAVFLVFLPCFGHKQEVYGRSFMLTQPGYQRLTMHNQLWQEIIYDKQGSMRGALQITPFFQLSPDATKTDHYFLINKKKSLLVSGFNNTALRNIRDVRAEWLGLSPNFSGTFSLRPKQMQTGIIFDYSQDLGNLIPINLVKDWKLNITIPLLLVENSLNPCQAPIENAPLATSEDLVAAFNQPSWCFGKMYTGHRSKSGIAEIKVCLESAYLAEDHFIIAYHSGLIIPACKKQNGEYLFDAVVGYNRHVGIVGGVDFQILLNRNPDRFAFCFFMDLESTFLIRNKQKRTFDLREKPWSRFLLFNRSDGGPNQNIPGVNVLTRECTVRPHNVVEFATGWRFDHRHFTFEFGYSIWGHDVEHIANLSNPFPSGVYGIAAVQSESDTRPFTASRSTIAQLSPVDFNLLGEPVFVAINEYDLDFLSAATGSALSHQAHFSFGMKNIGKQNNAFIGLGGFIEIPQKNGSFMTKGFWSKFGISF